MKKARVFLYALFLSVALLSGCGSGSSSSGGSSSSESGTISSSTNTVFYDAVREVAPSFSPSGVSSERLHPGPRSEVTASWESGNPLYELFYILREFNPDTDQGVIDTSNLYKTMYEARNFFSNTKEECTAITEQIIPPPFAFGNPATTYNCAYNQVAENGYHFGGAMKELDAEGNPIDISEESRQSNTAAAKYGLFGFVWVDPTHLEYGTLQGVYNSSTNDLSLDIATWVDYTGENDYCYRNDIRGNTGTHLFTFRSIKGNKVSGSSFISIVGKGYSQGVGQYFLLKVTNNDLTGKYYCIRAADGQTELQAMNAEGSSTVDANCAQYQADVDAMAPFTTADLACASSDFNPGRTGTAAEGTIFLYYE